MNESVKRLLMVFLRNPATGKVKTRLADTIGQTAALSVYRSLLEHTRTTALRVHVKRQVWYSDFIDPTDEWCAGFEQRLQKGEDLGERMEQAFLKGFEAGYEQSVIIGSDCPGLAAAHIEEAFERLSSADVVLGPAKDGGYYLLALKQPYPELFRGKSWSNPRLYRETLQTLALNSRIHAELEMLNDIDTEEDLAETGFRISLPVKPARQGRISIIVPALNEAGQIGKLVRYLLGHGDGHLAEVLVVDGGSSDQTVKEAAAAGAKVTVSPDTGRAAQMNYGAGLASGDILYFLHADTFPPPNFSRRIIDSVDCEKRGGCFRLRFDDSHPLLRLYGWFTRLNLDILRFGDQSLYVDRQLFEEIEGFDESHMVMEDQEIVKRIKKKTGFTLYGESVKTSARKFHRIGIIRLQLLYTGLTLMYYAGARQETLVHAYRTFAGAITNTQEDKR